MIIILIQLMTLIVILLLIKKIIGISTKTTFLCFDFHNIAMFGSDLTLYNIELQRCLLYYFQFSENKDRRTESTKSVKDVFFFLIRLYRNIKVHKIHYYKIASENKIIFLLGFNFENLN